MKYRKDLIGDHVRLRCIDESDAEFIVKLRSSQELNALSKNEISIHHHLKWYENYLTKDDDVYWVVLDKFSDERIGTSALFDIDMRSMKAESGRSIILKEYRDLVFDVFITKFRYGFIDLGLNKIYAHIREHESGILRYNNKLGFSVDGLLRQEYWDGENYISLYVISLLKDEFLANQPLYEKYIKALRSLSR
jgi:RimJ/RimL family protein N-acetyltransferase